MSSNNDSGNIDIGNVFSEKNGVSIDENARLKLGKQILFWLALICIGVFISYGMWPENKALAAIFELIKIGALPLVTLVVSFYFPNSNN